MGDNSLKSEGLLRSIFPVDKHFGLLLLAAFLFNACWMPDSLAVFMSGKPVNAILHTAFLLITGIAAAAVFLIYLLRSGHQNAKSFIGVLFSIMLMVIFISVSSILLNLWSEIFIPRMMKPGRLDDITGAGAFLILAFLINCIFLFVAKTCCVFIIYGTRLSNFGHAMVISLKSMLKGIHIFILYAVILFLLLILYYVFNDVLQKILGSILPAVFLSKFVLYLIISFLRAIVTGVVLHMCIRMNVKAAEEQQNSGSNVKSSISVLVLSMVTLALAVTTVVVALPGSMKGGNVLLADIEYRMLLADNMIQEGDNRQAMTEIARAEADLDSFQKYLKKILKDRGESIDAANYGISSKHLFSNCAYDDYFNVLLTIDSDEDSYNRGKLSNYINEIPESAIWAYGYYKEKGMKEQALKMFNSVVMQGVYTDKFVKIKKQTVAALNNQLEKAEILETELNRRKLYQYMERAKYEDRKALIKEIENFILQKGGNADLYAFVASLAETTAQGEEEYECMKENALKYYETAELYDDQERANAVEFVTYMLYRSFHNKEAVEFSGGKAQEYPHSMDMKLTYANALMENRNHKESNEVLLQLTSEDSYKDYMMAINYLEQGDYEKSLECADRLEKSLAASEKDEEKLDLLDFYLYGYILDCINYFEKDKDTSVSKDFGDKTDVFLRTVEKHPTDSLVYYNIIGLKNWFTQKYDESNKLFELVLDKYPQLSYPYLMIGVNYLEKNEVEDVDCSGLSEKYLLKYIQREPESEEAFFCIGHIYKHTNDKTRAQQAFNKVLEILPYSNDDYDEWGISHHTLLTNMGLGGDD